MMNLNIQMNKAVKATLVALLVVSITVIGITFSHANTSNCSNVQTSLITHIVSSGANGGGALATVQNVSACSFNVSFSSVQTSNNSVYDSQATTIGANQSLELHINVPDCQYRLNLSSDSTILASQTAGNVCSTPTPTPIPTQPTPTPVYPTPTPIPTPPPHQYPTFTPNPIPLPSGNPPSTYPLWNGQINLTLPSGTPPAGYPVWSPSSSNLGLPVGQNPTPFTPWNGGVSLILPAGDTGYTNTTLYTPQYSTYSTGTTYVVQNSPVVQGALNVPTGPTSDAFAIAGIGGIIASAFYVIRRKGVSFIKPA